MEGKKEKIFPWMKDVLQSFATSFMVDYDSNVLCILHRNIDKEINMIYSSNDRTIERTEALYKEIAYIYEHMRLKISQHPEFQNATLSCVKLMSQLIRVGLILTQGLINSEWIERILTALELFPGEKVLVYDALFLVNGLKKVHQKPYCTILRRIMTEDHHEFVTDPLVYMEIILLFRRLKALVLNRYKEKYNILVTKIKPPSNLISWLASLDVNGYSPYLKNLKYKKIAQQLMKKALPESFIKKIRYMALNQYNFEIEDSELKIPETKNDSSSVFIIDNTSSTKCDNLDMLENSHKAITKKKTNSQARRKRKPLLLNENIENDGNSQSNCGNKSSNICINESGIDNNNHKHFSKSNKTVVSKKKQKSNLSNSNERIIVSKKKKKSKSNLVKSSKSETSTNLNKDVSDNDLFFQDVEGSTLLHDIDGSTLFQVNKSTLSKEDPDSGSENEVSILYIDESDKNIASNKHSPNSAKHLTVSKKKRKLKSKNTESYASATVNKDVSNSDLFFRDGENNNIPEQSNKSTLNDKDSESSNEIKVSCIHINNSDTDQTTHKHFPSSTEHIIVSKKKKKSKRNLIKNNDSETSAIHSEDVPDSALFFHDVKGSSNSKKLKTIYNISNCSISSKRDLSEDTDTLDKNVSKDKNCKKLKSSKDGERTISDSSLSNNNKLDSNIVSHQQLMSENKNNKLENSFKDDESIVFETEVSGKKRKNITSIDDSASDDKCIYFKKLMLQKVSNQSKNTSTEISNEHKNVNSAVTVTDYSKMPDIKEKSKNVFVNVTENIPCENQSVQSENVRVKNLEENVIINESSSITESENETVPLKSVVNESFEEEKNAISNIPSDQSDNFNDSIHPKNIDNLSTEKENILIVQSSEKTKLLIEPKIADESSTLGTKIQTTEESNNSTINNLNSEWIEEDNLIKNKEFNVILLKSDTSIATVSNVECKDTENKQNMKESKETLKSNQIANEKSRPSTDVSENIPEPSQNVDVKNNKKSTPEKDMHSNFIITDCADLPIMAKGIPNKTQQMSDCNDPDKHACIAENNTSIDSSSCENSIIAQHNENFSTFPVEKTLYSTILDESSCKANLKLVDTQVSLEHENQNYTSAAHGSILLPTSPLNPVQSEGKSLLNDRHTKNVVNEHSAENSSVTESESKLEFKENSTGNICSIESFDKACLINIDKDSTLIDKISENNILHSIDQQDNSVQNMQNNVNTKLTLEKCINTDTSVAGDSENCEYTTKCAETTHVSSDEGSVCSDNKKIEENSLECESSKNLNIKEKILIAEVSILDKQIKHNDISMNLSIKTTVSDKEDSEISSKLVYVKNTNKKCVEKATEFEAMQKALHQSEDKEVCHHVEDNAEHSIISVVKKQEGKSEKKDAQALDKLNDEKISSMLVKERHVHEKSILDSQSEIISNQRIISNENILISNKLASLDTVNNSDNDLEISVKGKEYALQVVESEKLPDVSENSEKKDVLNSQIYIPKDNENSKENLSTETTLSSNESACSDNICSSENKAEISIKEEPQSLLESTSVVITSENSDKLNVVNSQDDLAINNKNNEKELLNETIPSSNDCSKISTNSSDNIKTSIKNMDSTIHSLPLIKKSVDACRNSDMFSSVNSQDSILGNENCERNSFCENIPSLKESTSFDNIGNPENDVKIVENTVHLLPVIKKLNDVCENSDQLNSIDSQNISLKRPTSSINLDNDANNVQVVKSTVIEKPVDACENSDELNSISSKNVSLKESTSSDNLNNPENDAKIVENTVHLLPVMEKSVDACVNSDELNSINSKDVSLKESISSDNLSNSENVKIVESTAHLSPVIEKPVDTCENSGALNSINSKDVSLKDSTSSDDLYNPENDVKMVESTIHLLPVIEKHIDAFENAGQLKAVNSQNDTIIGNENNLLNENVPSSKECSDNICNLANDFKVPGEITENNIHSVPVIENKIVPCENSDELKAVNYQDDNVTISNKKDLLNENSSFSKECSDNVNNPANGIKVSCEIMKNAIHSLPVIEKSIVACENSDMLKVVNSQDDNEKDLSNKNHSSQKEFTSFDNIHNSENDVKISDELINNTVPSSSLNEQLVDTCENSHQLSVVNSQNDCIRDDENKETNLSSEKNVTSSVKEKEDSLQLLESKNVEETPLNIKNTSSKKMDVEVKTSSLCAKSNLNERVTSCERMSKDNEREKSCERMSKDSESDADCNSDFQERYIVLDESYSDVDDCKSNYSEQSNENRSPKKKTVTATNKSKFKPLSSSDPSSRYLPENYNQQIENISEVSLQKSTNEMASIILPIKSDATDKSEIKSDISSSNNKSNYLHKKDTSEVSHRNCANDIDNTTSPVNTVAASESKLEGGPSSIDDCHTHLHVEDNPQIKPIFKIDTNKMDSTILPIKNDATNKSEIKSNISSSNDKSNNLHEKDTIEASCRSYSNDIDNTTLPLNAVAASESKFEGGLSSTDECHKHSCVKDDLQTKQTLKKDSSEVSQENCASEIDGTNSHESNLSDIKKDLEHSLEDSNSKEKLISAMHNQCSSVLQTESPKKEIKFAEIGEQIIKRMKRKSIEYPSEVSESLSITSFCNDKNRESFTEISVKNKDKSLDTKSVGSVPTNRFPYDPSTEFFSVYKNKLVNDKGNKTKASLSSKGQTFTEIPFKDKDKNIDIESEGSVPINNFSSTSSIELCKNKLTNEEDNKTKASLTSSNQCLTEVPFKDKDLDIETAGSVPINNFSSSVIASTESFDMYRNELTNDEDNKTEASLSSRDDILSNYQENDEIKSQTFSSDHSDDDDDDDFRSSSQEEEKDNCADDTITPSEDCNDESKTIDESSSLKNVCSTAETENDSLDSKNWAKDKSLSVLNVSEDSTHEKNSVTSVLPRQSLRLKTKTESKYQTNSGEISTSNISKIQEMSKKELKLVLVDCKSSLETENNTNNLSIENTFSCPLTHDNNEDIVSSQTSVIKKSISTAKDKSKESSTDCNKSAKRYSLRHRKSNRSRDDSANLGIDLNKLKFDSPKCTRSTRGSKYVKFLTSPPDDTKLQDNPSDATPTKRETRSSAKSDVGIEPNTPSYNLRNRKAIIAPARLNV